ncbi:acyltransferase [Hymenobacter koreensis]|uniref:acyltransferase family protein n=1 Tax=Hymenobacter koreensis TaxID=1084523 RepID=UPI0031ECA948
MQPTAAFYQPALTGLRALAAWLVFSYHFKPFSGPRFGTVIPALANENYTGQTIFFVLSGLLIGMQYAPAVAALPRPGWPKGFLRKRFARIYPLYFLLTTAALLLQATQTGGFSWTEYLLNISLLRGFSDKYLLSGLSQGWALTVEACFYLLMPWLILRRPAFGPRWWWLPVLLGCGAVAVLAARLLPLEPGLILGNFGFVWQATIFGRCFELLLGLQLAAWYRSRDNAVSTQKHWPAATLMGVIGLVAVLALLASARHAQLGGYEAYLGTVLHNGLRPIGAALLIWGLLTEKSLLQKLLGTRILQLLGRTAYVFLLIHMGPVHHWLRLHVTTNLLVCFLLLQLLAIAIHFAVEKPLVRQMGYAYR